LIPGVQTPDVLATYLEDSGEKFESRLSFFHKTITSKADHSGAKWNKEKTAIINHFETQAIAYFL
jgi:hypothetical protein